MFEEIMNYFHRYKVMLFVSFVILVLWVSVLRLEGRFWFCSCGHFKLWIGEPCGSETSQHFLDPYSFTHILHGLICCGITALLLGKMSVEKRFLATLGMEAFWEMIENTNFFIYRYRTETLSLGYTGDTIINSFGDICCCCLGFIIARRLGLKWSIVAYAIIELALLFWIKDSLTLNILMLIYPIEAIKRWQLG
ncbi:MAG: DUF2585 family protein [Candidatus Riflebacteria bacterium]|nr:DUF2585 family protein [Candidatus Riflebacteria bacterium]